MKTVNLLISGALGKMGKKVYEASLSNENITAVCGVDIAENFDNKNYPVYKGFDGVKEKVDVIIDFSSPLNLDNVLNYSVKNKIPAVLCTTGYSESDLKKIEDASKKVAIFRSANMSYGVNVLIGLVKEAAKKLYDYDIEIIEMHHNEKKDAPSGTALMLYNAINEEFNGGKSIVGGRYGNVGKRTEKEIGIHAIRGGNIVGNHEVLFAGVDETISLTHNASDRKVFAVGAIKAALFLSAKKKGLFDMNDLLK